MTDKQRTAYEWAKSHDYPSIAARHARELAGLVDELEEKQATKQATSDWISVEDRLPEDEKPRLAYYGFDNDGDGDLGMMFVGTLSYFCFDPEPHWQHASHNLVVTHWMPLPEPPKEEV